MSSPRLEDHGFDAFGHDPDFEARMEPWLDRLLDDAFRLHLEGSEHIPDDGRAILVCNHAGALPWDAVVLRAALRRDEPRRNVRPLVEDAVMSTPFIGAWMNRLGCVRASQENAVRVLERGEPVAVFPEGALRLALRTKSPIVPVAILGAEDTAPLLSRIQLPFARGGMPHLPITPTFPLLGPAGLLPLPARWRIRVLEPIDVAAEVKDAADALAVGEAATRVRELLQQNLRELVEARGSAFGRG
jgi:1-acyl-sn-glycerol-3-phosphate acyltransferase